MQTRGPRGSSENDYFEKDEWLFGDVLMRLRFGPRKLAFDADYVRGRMMKTTVSIRPEGELVVETRNRHEMALRQADASVLVRSGAEELRGQEELPR